MIVSQPMRPTHHRHFEVYAPTPLISLHVIDSKEINAVPCKLNLRQIGTIEAEVVRDMQYTVGGATTDRT